MGQCAGICGGGTTDCGGGVCTDIESDPTHCGACTGHQCASGEVCSAGKCALDCQDGLTNCGGVCVDVTSDHDNCSACGNVCPSGEKCLAGSCQATCQPGWTSCPDAEGGSTCVDTQSDPNNCNGCAMACQPGFYCSKGQCGLSCAGGTALCGSACVDEMIDPNHCGTCNTACGTGNVCTGGNCCATSTPYYCGGCDTFADCATKNAGRLVAGEFHTCAIDSLGKVYCWGDAGFGQLGQGAYTSSSKPLQVSLSGTPTWLGAGANHTCAVMSGGTSYCWGNDFDGQIGDGLTGGSDPSPVLTKNITTATRVGASANATCWVLASGAVDCAGVEYTGELADGKLGAVGWASAAQPSLVTSGALVLTSSIGAWYGLLTTSAVLDVWGSANGGLGDGTSATATPTVLGIDYVVAFSIGYAHACVVLAGGALGCWGANTYGELGTGTKSTMAFPTPVAATLTGTIGVCTGKYHTCAVTTSGSVECVGLDQYGELGDGSSGSLTGTATWQTAIASNATAVVCGEYHACALMTTGAVYCWGYNADGQVGNGTTNTTYPFAQPTAVQVTAF